MMPPFLKQISKYLPWIGLGILAIFLFIWLNPFGMWSSSKISLADTPTVLEELKELGEFITAEYNGETIQSLEGQEAAENRLQQELDVMPAIYAEIRAAYSRIAEAQARPRPRRRAWRNAEISEKYPDKLKLARKALSLDEISLLEYMIQEEMTWEVFWERHKPELLQEANRVLQGNTARNVKVAYIGRGRVKAGFDLSEVDNPIFQVSMSRNAAGDTMRIINLDPEILDADINPWYIYQPDKGLEIPGYELFKLSRPNKVEFEDITAVKLACKEKLIQNALNQRGILDFAIESGQTTFRDLFNMFRKDSETKLEYVEIIPTPFARFKAEVLIDQRFAPEEVDAVRSQIAEAGLELDSAPAKALILSLDKHRDKLIDPEPWSTLLNEVGL